MAACCMQAKCIANVAAVSASCDALPVTGVSGTCILAQGYTEKSNIANLPADPADWANPGTPKRVEARSNHADCCDPTTGRCTGNTNANSNVACGTGYKKKTDYGTIMGTTRDNCCDQKTCAD